MYWMLYYLYHFKNAKPFPKFQLWCILAHLEGPRVMYVLSKGTQSISQGTVPLRSCVSWEVLRVSISYPNSTLGSCFLHFVVLFTLSVHRCWWLPRSLLFHLSCGAAFWEVLPSQSALAITRLYRKFTFYRVHIVPDEEPWWDISEVKRHWDDKEQVH